MGAREGFCPLTAKLDWLELEDTDVDVNELD